MSTLTLKAEEARRAVLEDHFDFELIKEDIVDTLRWSTLYESILQHKSTGKFYIFEFSRGSTECQDESPYEYEDEVTVPEVEKKMVLVESWVVKKD